MKQKTARERAFDHFTAVYDDLNSTPAELKAASDAYFTACYNERMRPTGVTLQRVMDSGHVLQVRA